MVEEALKKTAEEILDAMSEISNRAHEELGRKTSISDSLAYRNDWTDNSSIANDIALQRKQGLDKARNKPCFMRVTLVDEDSAKTENYYFTESNYAPKVDDIINLAHSKAPIGTMMSLDIGEDIIIKGKTWFVKENIRFTPERRSDGWDGKLATFTEEDSKLEVLSLFNDIISKTDISDDPWATSNALFDENALKAEKRKNNIRKEMLLRSFPLLDKYQEGIYRLPLGTQLCLMGSAGTGKTTTLIRRLAQKVVINFLEDSEKEKVNNDTSFQNSWLMFTPTDLLVAYLEDAAAREEIINKSHNIKTWANYAKDLARNRMSILSTGTGKKGLILRDDRTHLSSIFFKELPKVFSDFFDWQMKKYESELKEALLIVNTYQKKNEGNIFIVHGESLYALFNDLKSQSEKIESLSLDLGKKISDDLNVILRSNKEISSKDEVQKFIASLVKFANDLKKSPTEDIDIEDEADEFDEEETAQIQTSQMQKILTEFFYKPLEKYARSLANHKTPSKRNIAFKEFFEKKGYVLDAERLKAIGGISNIKTALNKLKQPELKYAKKLPLRYKLFRKQNGSEKYFNLPAKFNANYVNADELDIILYAYFYILDDYKQRKIQIHPNSQLEMLDKEKKYQVYVDEMTDFSPIQLACMYRLAKQPFNSFFACGDFNQRLTHNGCSNKESVLWAVPSIKFEHIEVNYRQSKKLHDFAGHLMSLPSKATHYFDAPKNYVFDDGVNPVWLRSATDFSKIASWLSSRILEIQQQIDLLPSIAILVNSEKDISSLEEKLQQALDEENANIQVEGCHEGKFVGQTTNVRIFSVKHIKGLEFEAVFFVSIDDLAKDNDEFKKFMYVGATRAATYFGVTTKGDELPPGMEEVKDAFSEGFY